MSTRKNNINSRLIPINPADLNLRKKKWYSVFHFTDPKKDIEGFYAGVQDGNPVISTFTKLVQIPTNEYIIYPISTSRAMLKRFGITISPQNKNYPARLTPAFGAAPNFKRRRSTCKHR